MTDDVLPVLWKHVMIIMRRAKVLTFGGFSLVFRFCAALHGKFFLSFLL
jgi:hypothetical protein